MKMQTPAQVAIANFRSFAVDATQTKTLAPEIERLAAANGYAGYVTDAVRIARGQFCEAMAAATGQILDAAEPETHDAEINFVVDMAAELLGFALAAKHQSGFCRGCVQRHVQDFANTLISSFKHAAGEDEVAGHA